LFPKDSATLLGFPLNAFGLDASAISPSSIGMRKNRSMKLGTTLSSRFGCSSPLHSGANPLGRGFPQHLNLMIAPFSSSSSSPAGGSVNRNLGTTKVPTPQSSPPQDPSTLERLKQVTPKSLIRQGTDLTISLFKSLVTFLIKLPGNVLFYLTHPDDLRQALAGLKKTAQEEIHHYWVGFKLLWAEIQTARMLVGRTLQGSTLTRRERKQLLRTITDLIRMVPFSVFIIIPFMEFALPIALRLFPNMLPSTFQDSLKAEETMKRELQSRIAMAQFFQEYV
jgi:LETM1-like protein